MIQISQIKLQIPHTEEKIKEKIKEKICRLLRIRESELVEYRILKKSLDARKKPTLFYVYTVEAKVRYENTVKRRVKNPNVTFREPLRPYEYISSGKQILTHRPVIIGTGPAGLFCGYALSRMGYRPILLERGADVEERMKDVEGFWNGGELKKNSNVQFGEGGAGTFSDGKLNTLVHDTYGRNQEVLKIFVKYGAPDKILYESKPHIGTDILTAVVKNIRNAIIEMGGEVRFHALVTDIEMQKSAGDTSLAALKVKNLLTGETESLKTSLAVLAIGHSARDTFDMLLERKIPMEAKAFAVGVRMEHPQSLINENQYGKDAPESLPAAPYKLAVNLENGRGVYTFCMCPGGYVVNASSEEGRIAVNGMSYSKRDGKNANTAVIVTVTPEDYGKDSILSGMEFQRQLEECAYREGKGSVPVQLFGDFRRNVPSKGPGSVLPQIKGKYTWANVRNIFPEYLAQSLEEGILRFDRKISGYAGNDAVLSAVESRTSSPVRILRDETLQSTVKGFYPCGEGAGYTGGITSAAMDGLKVAEAVSQIYRPFDTDRKA